MNQNRPENSEQGFSEADQWKWALDAALQTRQLEIELFWRRANFFWGFQIVALTVAGFVLGSGSGLEGHIQLFVFLSALTLGFWAGMAGYLSARGSKYWQSVWEHRLEQLEPFRMFGSSTARGGGFLGAGSWSVSKQYIAFIFMITACWAILIISSPLYIFVFMTEPDGASLKIGYLWISGIFVYVAIFTSVVIQAIWGKTHSIIITKKNNEKFQPFELPDFIKKRKRVDKKIL